MRKVLFLVFKENMKRLYVMYDVLWDWKISFHPKLLFTLEELFKRYLT